MVYGLEDWEVDVPSDDRLFILEKFANKLLDSKVISQYDVTNIENRLKYNIFTKIMPLKSYTLVPSETNMKQTLFCIKTFKKEYSDVMDKIKNDKLQLRYRIIATLNNITDNLGKIKEKINLESLDKLFSELLSSRIRNKKDNHFENLSASLEEYSEYCKNNGIKDPLMSPSSLDVLIKMYKYEDLNIGNIIHKVEIDIYCTDVYYFLRDLINSDDKSVLNDYEFRLSKLLVDVNSMNSFTCEEYNIILETLELSVRFTESVLESIIDRGYSF